MNSPGDISISKRSKSVSDKRIFFMVDLTHYTDWRSLTRFFLQSLCVQRVLIHAPVRWKKSSLWNVDNATLKSKENYWPRTNYYQVPNFIPALKCCILKWKWNDESKTDLQKNVTFSILLQRKEFNILHYIYCCGKGENLFTSTFFSSRNGLVSGLADQYKSPSKFHAMIKKNWIDSSFFFYYWFFYWSV